MGDCTEEVLVSLIGGFMMHVTQLFTKKQRYERGGERTFYRYIIYFSKEEIEQDAKTYPVVKYGCL